MYVNRLSDTEKESAVNGYLMSLAVFATTMPFPVINLIANIIYYIRRRKSVYITRWHSMNAFVSQLPLFFINSFTWYSAWQIIWDDWHLNGYFVAYYVVAAILNIAEIVLSIVCCIKIKHNKEVNWIMVSPFCHIFCAKKSWDEWQRSWVSADPIYEKLAEESKPRLLRDVAVSVFSVVVLYFLILAPMPKSNDSYPDLSLFSLIEDHIYDSYVNGHELEDEKATESLRKCVDHLREANGIDSVNVYLVKSNQVNVFAYSGRNMVVFTSLIEKCDSVGELLAVVGHELGHIERDHVRQSVKQNVGISLLFSIFLGNTSGIMTDLTTNHLSRSDEREADTLSVRYLYNANINPISFASFMGKLLNGSIADNYGFFSDHPATQERIDKCRAQVANLPAKEYIELMDKDEWRVFKEKVQESNVKPFAYRPILK